MSIKAARRRTRQPVPDMEKENEELKRQLAEAQETLRAIRSGEVDAMVISTPEGERVFSLRGAETPYRVIVENISEGAATLLPDGTILYANSAFSSILNMPLERILGSRLHDFVREPDRELLRHLFEKASQETARAEISIIRGNKPAPVYVSLRSLPHDERDALSMVLTDISARKRAEEELRKAHDELDARVHQRTMELQRAIENLERSNKELQQFAYVASHDLQEPLRTVSSFVELLKMRYLGKLDRDADTYISFAVEGAQRMSRLIDDLLVYSRVETKGKAFSMVDLNSVLEQAVDNLKSSTEENHAEITHDTLPSVRGDETQLVQLLQNLLANAIKFRKKDVQPRIHISVASDKDRWRIGVHDNGIGIEPRFFQRIFTIFQRLHTREEYSGTGVGLAICKKIVERHGGRIWLESKPGEGSSFYFTLPVRDKL